MPRDTKKCSCQPSLLLIPLWETDMTSALQNHCDWLRCFSAAWYLRKISLDPKHKSFLNVLCEHPHAQSPPPCYNFHSTLRFVSLLLSVSTITGPFRTVSNEGLKWDTLKKNNNMNSGTKKHDIWVKSLESGEQPLKFSDYLCLFEAPVCRWPSPCLFLSTADSQDWNPEVWQLDDRWCRGLAAP